jgi:hypothetical protein
MALSSASDARVAAFSSAPADLPPLLAEHFAPDRRDEVTVEPAGLAVGGDLAALSRASLREIAGQARAAEHPRRRSVSLRKFLERRPCVAVSMPTPYR